MLTLVGQKGEWVKKTSWVRKKRYKTTAKTGPRKIKQLMFFAHNNAKEQRLLLVY